MDDDSECPDSTVIDDEEEMEDDEEMMMSSIPFSHRRSLDEQQSSRISSTFGAAGNFQSLPSLPPLPKLILRPPALGGHYPSVSFASQLGSSGLSSSRVGSSGSSRLDSLHHHSQLGSSSASSRLPFPSSSATPSNSRVSLSPAPPVSSSRSSLPALPRLEQMSRSELTISRVGSAGTSSGSRGGSRNDFARVGGVSISRVDGSMPMARAGGSSSGGSLTKRIAIPALHRIGGSRSSGSVGLQQADLSATSRKFGRRFLKSSPVPVPSSPKPQMQKMPMSVVRAASTEEFYSPPPQRSHSGGRLSSDDPTAIDAETEGLMEFSEGRRQGFFGGSVTPVSLSSRKSSLASSESLTSQQSSQGIKLHISKSKRPVGIMDDDESYSPERATTSRGPSFSSDVNIGIPFEFQSGTNSTYNRGDGINDDEMTVKPFSLKDRLKIPSGLIIDEAPVDDEDESAKDMMMYEESSPSVAAPSFMQRLLMDTTPSNLVPTATPGVIRRTRRKREPAETPQSPPKVRRRRGGGAGLMETTPVPTTVVSMNQAAILVTTDALGSPSRGRGRGTGRGRGRPRGSTNKAKLERELLQKANLLQQLQSQNQDEEAQLPPSADEIESKNIVKEDVDGVKEGESPVVDTTSPGILDSNNATPLPLEGDPAVNSEITSNTTPSPTRKPRGRRGAAGTPRGAATQNDTPRRGARGGTRTPRGSKKKSPEEKKQKVKPEKKEAVLVSPPVQVFEEETRMSADIKPPVPERLSALATPIVVDEESRASNVSSTSTSTTNKAKRFTKDPIEERKPVTAETLFEYQWPLNEKDAEFYFLQEQISEFLGVKSFKRKYPDIRRRIVDMEERDYLRNSKVVSETQCDLGLTAVYSCDVLDIMCNDFNEKYEEYRKAYQEKKEQELAKLKPQNGTEAAAVVRDRSAEFMRRILKSCATWNFNNNLDRKEQRQCAYDLQTNTFHSRKSTHKILPPEATKVGHYPVAVLPGQFAENYKTYTPDELFYLPLNSVRYGPINPKLDMDSISSESESESDDSSSSDDSTSSSDDDGASSVASDQNVIVLMDDSGTVLFKGRSGPTKVSTDAKCKTCEGGVNKNKDGNSEVLLHCSRCDVANHPTCLELTIDMLPFITKYLWECTDCKNCIECNDPADEDKMLFCDCCDRGYHIYCVGLRKVPTGRWHCSVCAVCHSCGVTQPSQDDRMAEWHHEYRKGEKGAKFYLHSLCVACHKLQKKGHFCPSCRKVHLKFDKEALMECRKCEKWVHKACVKKRPLKSMFGFMCDPCEANFRSRSSLPSHVK